MKAIRVSAYGGPEVLKLEEIPAPKPDAGQVLVRNHAVGVNPVDTYLRSNTDNRGPKLPYTPGSDTAGVVEAVGNGVTSVKPGDRVYVGGTASGAYAELSLCGEAQVHPLPARVSYAQGAAMNVPYATEYHALFQRGHGHAGESLLVHGGSGGGGNRGTIAINPRGAVNKNAAIIGVALFHASPAQLAGIHAALVEGLGNGTLRPVIAQEIPLAQAPRAHEAVMAAGHRGKIVLVP